MPDPAVIRFRFELRPLAEVAPWGGDQPSLSWYSLTDGRYWIELGDVELLRYVPEEGEVRPYVDYYVVRLWEDLLQLFPAAIEDVPMDLVDVLRTDASDWSDLDDLDDPAVEALGLVLRPSAGLGLPAHRADHPVLAPG